MKKRNRVLALTVAAAMSASLLAGCGSSAQQGGAASSEAASTDTAASVSDGGEDNIIRVGVVCSMTGGSTIYGEGAQNAVDMAVEEINAGDSGYKIEIVNGGKVADDAKDAKQAMNAYNKVMADSPEAIVGSFFSSVTLPMAEQASKDGMLLLATGATNADVTLKGDSIFRNCFIDPYQGKMAALFAKDKGFAKVAVIYAKDDDYSNGLKDAFVENCEANGIEVAYVGECMTTDTDYSSQAAQAVASGADLLYYPCFLDTVPLLVGACNEPRRHPRPAQRHGNAADECSHHHAPCQRDAFFVVPKFHGRVSSRFSVWLQYSICIIVLQVFFIVFRYICVVIQKGPTVFVRRGLWGIFSCGRRGWLPAWRGAPSTSPSWKTSCPPGRQGRPRGSGAVG